MQWMEEEEKELRLAVRGEELLENKSVYWEKFLCFWHILYSVYPFPCHPNNSSQTSILELHCKDGPILMDMTKMLRITFG